MKYSIELVPRSWEILKQQVQKVNRFKEISILNVPEVLRFDIRSWEACKAMQNNFQEVIPHLRAIDFNLKTEFPLTKFMLENKIGSVLVIAGDPPQDASKRTYRNTSCELIRILKKELPGIRVYAGVDQYRSSIRKELDYIHDKLDAGADGLFTQPFFDLKYLDMYMDMLKGTEVFWGISPVQSEQSLSYWENRNDAIFPSHFEPTKQWNVKHGRKMIEKIAKVDGNVYFMPIRAKASEYLNNVLK